MEILNVALPDALKQFIRAQVGPGKYQDESEYIQELVRADQRRKDNQRIEALLLEGLDSGGSILADDAFWEEKKRKLVEKYGEADGTDS